MVHKTEVNPAPVTAFGKFYLTSRIKCLLREERKVFTQHHIYKPLVTM